MTVVQIEESLWNQRLFCQKQQLGLFEKWVSELFYKEIAKPRSKKALRMRTIYDRSDFVKYCSDIERMYSPRDICFIALHDGTHTK